MARAKIPSLKEYMAHHKIKAPKSETQGEVSVRMCSYSNSVEHMDIDELDEFSIRVPKEILEDTNISEFVKSITSYEYNFYGFLRDQKKLEDSASITLEEFIRQNKKSQFVTSKGPMSGAQIMRNSKIVVMRPAESKFSDLLTFEFVKLQDKDALIILDKEAKDKTNKVTAFLLAYKLQNPEREFKTIGNDYDSTIASHLVEPLGIDEVNGVWKEEPLAALFYLDQIKNQEIRKIYALAYSKIYEYSQEGWQSDKPEDITEHHKLHKIFEKMQEKSATHTILEQAQNLLETKDFEECEFDEKLETFFEELLKEELKKIENEDQRINLAAQICLKDKIKEGSLSVSIAEEDYSPDITLSFELIQKTKLSKDFFDLVTESIKGFRSFESVSIEGNKVEVVLG